jgi:hypothetical protein
MMERLSNKLRRTAAGDLAFWCPGCKEAHVIGVGAGAGPRWTYNGNPDAPTFTPSVLVTSGHYCPGADPSACWCAYRAQHPDDLDAFECSCCHSFVTDGRIQFLGDCTHALAGQTIDLPDWGAP